LPHKDPGKAKAYKRKYQKTQLRKFFCSF